MAYLLACGFKSEMQDLQASSRTLRQELDNGLGFTSRLQFGLVHERRGRVESISPFEKDFREDTEQDGGDSAVELQLSTPQTHR